MRKRLKEVNDLKLSLLAGNEFQGTDSMSQLPRGACGVDVTALKDVHRDVFSKMQPKFDGEKQGLNLIP